MSAAMNELVQPPGLGALLGSAQIASELSALAERVRQSVIVVRGTRFGGGSGVVWSEEGLVLTNHHVAPGRRAEVILGDGRRYQARVKARSERYDLAALQIEGAPAGLVPAPLGDSSRLRPGELVMAVGNPLGERNAVTIGVVSATGAGAAAWLRGPGEVLQLSLTLRPGNSGGALVDIHGRLVGIPHMVVRSGLALAVPSRVVERFLGGDRGERGRLGVGVQWVELPAPLVERYELPASAGLVVVGVSPDSPAERAGIVLGDVLAGVAEPGARLAPAARIVRFGGLEAGRPVRLAVLRGGALQWREATPEAPKDEE